MKTNSKMIAASLSLMTSVSAVAGMGGLDVQSNLGEPFAGSIVVTGNEAKAVLQSGTVSVAGGNIQGTVVPQNNGNAVIRLRSATAVNEPVLNFVVKAGNQTRQYIAMINPPSYRVSGAVSARPNRATTRVAPVVATESQNTPEQAATTTEAKNTSNAVAEPRNPRYYRVQSGESVAEIAARHRPKGMSVQRAVRALVAANPRAFRNGNPNTMYRNVTLYIPTTSQWHHYAQSGQKRRHVAPLRHRHLGTPAVAGVATNDATSSVAAPTPQAEPVTTAPQAQQTVSQPAPTPEPVVTQPVASEPTTEAVKVASAPVVASEPVATVVSAPVSAVAAPAPAQPKPAPVVQEEAPVEEETDWMQMGLLGGAAVAAGGLAYYALSRRRKQGEAESDDEFELDNSALTAPIATTAAQRVRQSKDAVEEESRFSDDVFFEEDTASAPASNKVAEPAFDLNDFEPENSTFAPDTSSEEWEWAADTQSKTATATTAPVVEEDLSFDALMADMESTPVASEPVEAVKNAPVVEEVGDDLAWLDAQLAGDDGTFAVSATSVETINESVDDSVDLDFGHIVASHQDGISSNEVELDLDVTAPAVGEVVFETPVVEEENLDFNLPEMEKSVLSVPEVADEALSFDLPATDSVAEEFTLDETVVVDVPQLEMASQQFEDGSLDFLADVEESVQAAVEPVDLTNVDDLAFSVEEPTLSTVDVAVSAEPVVVETAAADELLAWDNAVPTVQQSAGFVSEAVGMTAPLEAKLELAKMYLEIDDAVAARETLRELIAESTGDVHDQASALLEELGG